MRMRVDGVKSLKDYRRVVDYLSGVRGVKQVVAETLTPTSATLRITAEGSMDSVLQVIALGKTIDRVEQPQSRQSTATMPLNGVSLMRESDREGEPSAFDGADDTRGVARPPQPELVYRLIP
jgi:hypothetical protein